MNAESRIELTARIAHEVNRAFCERIGDDSQVPWDQAPEWQRDSCIAGVRAQFAAKCRLSPAQSHEEWVRHKRENGWKFGFAKDIEAKLHPCMLAYSDLPRNQQTKDVLFKAVCEAAFEDASP